VTGTLDAHQAQRQNVFVCVLPALHMVTLSSKRASASICLYVARRCTVDRLPTIVSGNRLMKKQTNKQKKKKHLGK